MAAMLSFPVYTLSHQKEYVKLGITARKKTKSALISLRVAADMLMSEFTFIQLILFWRPEDNCP